MATGVLADCISSGLLTVEPVNAYNKAYAKYPKIKYTIVIIPKYGVIIDISKTAFNNSGSKNTLADINATPTITHICINPTIPIPIVFPNTIVLGDVEVTNVSIIFEVFSVVIELDT